MPVVSQLYCKAWTMTAVREKQDNSYLYSKENRQICWSLHVIPTNMWMVVLRFWVGLYVVKSWKSLVVCEGKKSSVNVEAEKKQKSRKDLPILSFTLSLPNATFLFTSFTKHRFFLLPCILDTSFVQNSYKKLK